MLKVYQEVLMSDGVSRVSCSVALQTKKTKTRSNYKRVGIQQGSINGVNSFLKRLGISKRVKHAVAYSETLLDVILLRDFSAVLSAPELSPRKTFEDKPKNAPRRGNKTGFHGASTSENGVDFSYYEVIGSDEIDFSIPY